MSLFLVCREEAFDDDTFFPEDRSGSTPRLDHDLMMTLIDDHE